jgi:hypothetical protein
MVLFTVSGKKTTIGTRENEVYLFNPPSLPPPTPPRITHKFCKQECTPKWSLSRLQEEEKKEKKTVTTKLYKNQYENDNKECKRKF